MCDPRARRPGGSVKASLKGVVVSAKALRKTKKELAKKERELASCQGKLAAEEAKVRAGPMHCGAPSHHARLGKHPFSLSVYQCDLPMSFRTPVRGSQTPIFCGGEVHNAPNASCVHAVLPAPGRCRPLAAQAAWRL